jgi:hypothetical protein
MEALVDNLRSQRKPDCAYPGPEGPGLRRYSYHDQCERFAMRSLLPAIGIA